MESIFGNSFPLCTHDVDENTIQIDAIIKKGRFCYQLKISTQSFDFAVMDIDFDLKSKNCFNFLHKYQQSLGQEISLKYNDQNCDHVSDYQFCQRYFSVSIHRICKNKFVYLIGNQLFKLDIDDGGMINTNLICVSNISHNYGKLFFFDKCLDTWSWLDFDCDTKINHILPKINADFFPVICPVSFKVVWFPQKRSSMTNKSAFTSLMSVVFSPFVALTKLF